MKPVPPTGGVLPQLDGLRGAGALLVFLFHHLSSLPYHGLTVPAGPVRVCTNLGVLSIDVFFAASGLILFRSLERLRERSQVMDRRVALGFYLRRFFRIVPLWWLVLTIELVRQRLDLGVYLANATFLFGFLAFDLRYLPILVAWTLFVEVSFYALLPVVFRWIRGIPSALVFLALMIGVARLWRHQAPLLGVPSDHHFIDDFPLSCFKFFAVGILVHFLLPRVPARWSPWLDAAAVAGVGVTAMVLRFATPAVFLLLLAVLVPGSRLGRWIAVAPLAFAGVHCYFVYLTHNQLFLGPVLDLVLGAPPGSPLDALPKPLRPALVFVVAVVLCLAAARVSMRLFEAPMMRLGKRLASWLLAGGPARQASALPAEEKPAA